MDLLKELFPDVAGEKLELTLESAQGDVELATSMLLSEMESDHHVNGNDNGVTTIDHVHEVELMFPDIDAATVASVYRQEKGMVPNVITHLLNLEYLKNESMAEQEGEKHVEQIGIPLKRKAWKSTYDEMDTVAHVLQWPQDQIPHLTQLYQENSFSSRRTIVSIILDQIHPMSRSPRPITQISRHDFSRVQSNRGFAHKKGKQQNNNLSSLLNKKQATQKQQHIEQQRITITYDEYLDMIKEDPYCQGVNPQFVSNLFQYFKVDSIDHNDNTNKADLESCFRVLSYILDDPNGVAFTFNKHPDGDGSWNVVVSNTNGPGNKRNSKNYSVASSNNKNRLTMDPQNDDVFQTFKIDFHGYSPKQAVTTLNQIMNSWWDEELKQRELNNYNLRQRDVVCLEPLMVVTGRGIHSIGGKSPVRIQVKRYLQLNGYLFHEEPSYFQVYGKKPKPAC